ncbi:DUF3592 domain-containing protein [Marnyiella aurantia]|uniref:DUF3592 domain-containing protein n=1 Tax=Marnyiella aurantia TaxID=2758037 RepID=A0A7D7LR41_9FLAO|nr:DUF3592 domain-containing protein [Marnyiella aurantia]MBA5245742.1 DUF3592 domain-containing protein [Marnyiella aurantia]QMS98854.1 DUF3592 domain-containing protein [Marnyiella aurantia]
MKFLKKYWYYIIGVFAICMFVKPTFCFIILGSVIFYAGIDYYRVFRIVKNYGIVTTGKVIKYTRGQKGYQTPTINFSTKNGKTIETEPYFYVSSDINKFRTFKKYIKKPIEINYNPENPEEFLIADQKGINAMGIIILILVGALFAIIGTLGFLEIIEMNFNNK